MTSVKIIQRWISGNDSVNGHARVFVSALRDDGEIIEVPTDPKTAAKMVPCELFDRLVKRYNP